jgi:hypothetical protein
MVLSYFQSSKAFADKENFSMTRLANQKENILRTVVIFAFILTLDVSGWLRYFYVVLYVCLGSRSFDFYGGCGYKWTFENPY